MAEMQPQPSPHSREPSSGVEIITPMVLESLRSEAQSRGIPVFGPVSPTELLSAIAKHYRIAHTIRLETFVERVKQLGLIAPVSQFLLGVNRLNDLNFSPLAELIISNAVPSPENLLVLLKEVRATRAPWVAEGLIAAIAADPISRTEFNAYPRGWLPTAKMWLSDIQKHHQFTGLFNGAHFAAATIVLERSQDVFHDLQNLFLLSDEAVTTSAEFLRNFYDQGYRYIYGAAALRPLVPRSRIPAYSEEVANSPQTIVAKSLALSVQGPTFSEAARCLGNLRTAPRETQKLLATLALRMVSEPIPYKTFSILTALAGRNKFVDHQHIVIPVIVGLPAERLPIAVTLLEDVLTDPRVSVESLMPLILHDQLEKVAAILIEMRRKASDPPAQTPSIVATALRANVKDSPSLRAVIVRASMLAAEIEHRRDQTLRMSGEELTRSIQSLQGDTARDPSQFLIRYLSCAQELLRRLQKIPLTPDQIVTLILMVDETARGERMRTGALLHGPVTDTPPALWAVLAGYHSLQGRKVDRLMRSAAAAKVEHSQFKAFFESIGAFSTHLEPKIGPYDRQLTHPILYSSLDDFIFNELRRNQDSPSNLNPTGRDVCLCDSLDQRLIDEATLPYSLIEPMGWDLYPSTLKKLLIFAQELPQHLPVNDLAGAVSSFIEGNLDARNVHPLTMVLYLRNAIRANQLEENRDYIIRNQSVIIVDRFGSELPLPDRVWPEGLHSLVAAKHDLPIPSSATGTRKTTISGFLAGYRTLYGLTPSGTTREELVHLRLHTELRVIGLTNLCREVRTPTSSTVFETPNGWLRYLTRCATEATTGDRPSCVILVVRSSVEAEHLVRELRRSGRSVELKSDPLPPEIGRSDQQLQLSLTRFGTPGTVHVVTPEFLLGTAHRSPLDSSSGGVVHTIMTYTPRDRREEFRARALGDALHGIGTFEIATCLQKDPLLWDGGEATRSAFMATLSAFGPASEEVQRLLTLIRGYNLIQRSELASGHSLKTRVMRSGVKIYYDALRSISKPYQTRRGALELYGDVEQLFPHILPSRPDYQKSWEEIFASFSAQRSPSTDELAPNPARLLTELFRDLYDIPLAIAGLAPQESADRIAAEMTISLAENLLQSSLDTHQTREESYARGLHALTAAICEKTQDGLEPISKEDLARMKEFIEETLDRRGRPD